MVFLERSGRLRPDAAIGVVLSSFFSLGIVLLTALANSAGAAQAGLETYLFGQAAGLLEGDLQVMALLMACALAAVALGFRALKTTLFDPAFAAAAGLRVRLVEVAMTVLLVVAVVVGLRTVGAILMVAMLVVPTVCARQVADRLVLVLPVAGLVGAAVGVTGALAAERAEAPAGPVIVLVGFLVVMVALLFAPGRGVLWRAKRLGADRRRARTEGVLLDVETAMHAGPPPTCKELSLAGGRSERTFGRALRELERSGLLARDGERVHLTEPGAAAAHRALERRALWGAWLEHGWRLDLPDAREPDPRDLRGSLGDAAADRLRALAGGSSA
jgi:manganese/zinc/iron transport system permease protein